MKNKILLLILAMVLLIGSANADVIYKVNGHHLLEDSTNSSSDVIGFFQEEELTFYTGDNNISSESYSSGSNILYFRLKYQDEDMSLKEIDNVTLICYHQTWSNIGGDFGFYTISNETQVVFFDKNSRQSEDFNRLYFQVFDNDKVYCEISTYWNIEEWQIKGKQPPDLNGLSMAWELPSAHTDYCEESKRELEDETRDYFTDSYEKIQGYIQALILTNYKFWIIIFWLIKIIMYPFAFMLILMILLFGIDAFKNLLQKRRQSVLHIKRGK